VNQTIDASKMLGALELANPVTITSESGVLTLTADSNSFIVEGSEAITSIVGDTDVTQGIYVITWNTARTLSYSASALLLVGQADKTTAIGDVGVYQLNNGVVTELLYQPIAGYAAASHVHDVATESSDGFMSSSDKTKLDGIATGAEVNQDAFSNVLVGDTTIAADAETATVELEAGTNIVLTADATNKKVTIAVSGQVANAAAADTATVCTGNAATATQLATARTLSFTGDATGSLTFDGSSDESAELTLSSSGVTAGTYQSVTVDAKGRVTDGTNPTSLDIDITGNAATATKLATARTIALTGAVTGSGTFDGSGDLSITTSAGSVIHGKQMFTSSGTFTVPDGVTEVWVSMCGGGGGGGGGGGSYNAISGAGGGGAAAYLAKAVTVTSGESITITIGAAGSAGASGGSGGSGGTSSFGSRLSCAGGGGGGTGLSASGTSSGGSAGGTGGSAGGCYYLGTDGVPWGSFQGGGSIFGAGGAGCGASIAGRPGSGYGAGGGGGASGGGGAGTQGFVLVEW